MHAWSAQHTYCRRKEEEGRRRRSRSKRMRKREGGGGAGESRGWQLYLWKKTPFVDYTLPSSSLLLSLPRSASGGGVVLL